jgi:hypothetical protein
LAAFAFFLLSTCALLCFFFFGRGVAAGCTEVAAGAGIGAGLAKTAVIVGVAIAAAAAGRLAHRFLCFRRLLDEAWDVGLTDSASDSTMFMLDMTSERPSIEELAAACSMNDAERLEMPEDDPRGCDSGGLSRMYSSSERTPGEARAGAGWTLPPLAERSERDHTISSSSSSSSEEVKSERLANDSSEDEVASVWRAVTYWNDETRDAGESTRDVLDDIVESN